MEKLKENEWNTINDMLLEIYTIRTLQEFTVTLLKMFRMIIPYTKGYFIVFDEEGNIENKKSYFINMSEESKKKYISDFYEIDYLKYVLDFAKSTKIYRDTDILENDIRKKTEFYKNFLHQEDIPYGCGILCVKDRETVGIINLFRSEDFGDFTNKDMYILDILKQHLTNIICRLTNRDNDNFMSRGNSEDFVSRYELSEREGEITELLKIGYSNAEIGEKLIISISTVKKHIYNIYMKTGVKSRTQLIALLNET
ncbi:Hypothetical protein CM240_3175 [Clostridium bornimense]|uniref:HTH luxR-type domain-containing protein n=1 Tax=Clostridium bornimense TaxID=1216932 RepID=W6S7A4_9CLOT|nr:helix-turn-helix transcriptional regulator [Clostridium bornimense]CDM70292.1 Hypothetical protein CM240_3175 [Clostridium bornimense]